MKIRNKQDLWSGVMFVAIGSGFAFHASSYGMGTPARMGPGYFPFWLGLLLAAMGMVVLTAALAKGASEAAVGRFDWRILFMVVSSVALYGLLLRFLGLYVSTFLLVVVSSYASHEFDWKVAVANAVFLVLFSYLAFVRGLGLIFPLWPDLPDLT